MKKLLAILLLMVLAGCTRPLNDYEVLYWKVIEKIEPNTLVLEVNDEVVYMEVSPREYALVFRGQFGCVHILKRIKW